MGYEKSKISSLSNFFGFRIDGMRRKIKPYRKIFDAAEIG